MPGALIPALLLAAAALGARLLGWHGATLLLGLGALGMAMGRRWPARLAGAGVLALTGLGLLAAGAARGVAPAALLPLLPALGLLMLSARFAATLLPGREPLITHYTRFDFGRLPPECAGYTRRLTGFWAALLALAAPLQAAAPLAGLAPGAVAAAGSALMLGLFLAEHALRDRCFPHLGPATPARTLRAIIAAHRNTAHRDIAAEASAAGSIRHV